MKTLRRGIQIIVGLLFACSLSGQTVRRPDDFGEQDDEMLASRTGADNYISAIHAAGRLGKAKNYPALCRLLQTLSHNRGVESLEIASAKGVILAELLDAKDDLTAVNNCLLTYLEDNNREILNANGDGAGQYMIKERIIGRLSRVSGITLQGVNIFSAESVADFIGRVRPIMVHTPRSAGAPINHPTTTTRNSEAITTSEPAHSRADWPSTTGTGSIIGGRSRPIILAWLAVAGGAIGLFWLVMKSRRK